MNTRSGSGAVPTIAMFDYLQPGINRPDLFEQQAYPIAKGGGGSTRSLQHDTANSKERSPLATVYYTLGLIVASAVIFITIGAWSNVLLSWLDSIYVSPLVSAVTTSRLYFALIMTAITIVVVALAILIWYFFTVQKGV